jgi:hypothetical protein
MTTARQSAALVFDSAGNAVLCIASRDASYTGVAQGDDVILADVLDTAVLAGVPANEITEAIASLKAEGFLVSVTEYADDLIGHAQSDAVNALDSVQQHLVFVNENDISPPTVTLA